MLAFFFVNISHRVVFLVYGLKLTSYAIFDTVISIKLFEGHNDD